MADATGSMSRLPRSKLYCSRSLSEKPSRYSRNTEDHHRSDRGGTFEGIGAFYAFRQCEPCDVSPNPNPDPDLKQWSFLMKEAIHRMEGGSVPIRNIWSCMRVPKALTEVRPQAYSPKFLFIGPHNDRFSRSTLSFMDHCRALCVNQFLSRCSSGHAQQLDQLMADLFHQGRKPEPVDSDMESLELLIAVDSIFVLNFILCFMKKKVKGSLEGNIWDQYFSTITLCHMQRDLFMVGNQVPFSYLVSLAGYQGLGDKDFFCLLWKMIREYCPFISLCDKSCDSKLKFKNLLLDESLGECKHLLDCLYKACVLKLPEQQNHRNDAAADPQAVKSRGWCSGFPSREGPTKVSLKPGDRIPRASELSKVGVKFHAVNGTASAINYDRENLIVQLPKLVVDDGTECKLRNLVAYELTSNCNDKWEICSYVMLMDSLIDKTDDLDILYKAQVLQNHLGSDEKLVAMWNEMRANIQLPITGILENITVAILTAYRTYWRKIYVEFRRRFFSRPWYTLSTLAALLLLFMTALQTVYTVMGFYKA